MQPSPDYVRWYPGAIALARSLLSALAQPHERAKDVVQQAVAQLIERGEHLDNYRKAWFFSVVRNACIDELRRQRRFSSASEADNSSAEAGPAEQILAHEQQQQVQLALQSLPFEQREILLLREVNDLSYAMIAQVLQINSGTVMSRLHRARLALRDKFQLSMNEQSSATQDAQTAPHSAKETI